MVVSFNVEGTHSLLFFFSMSAQNMPVFVCCFDCAVPCQPEPINCTCNTCGINVSTCPLPPGGYCYQNGIAAYCVMPRWASALCSRGECCRDNLCNTLPPSQKPTFTQPLTSKNTLALVHYICGQGEVVMCGTHAGQHAGMHTVLTTSTYASWRMVCLTLFTENTHSFIHEEIGMKHVLAAKLFCVQGIPD